jgi:hypothetical protein
MTEGTSIVTEVVMKNSEKWYRLASDGKLRSCSQPCAKAALYDGVMAGDEVQYSLNQRQDQITYMKKTGQHFDVKEQPKPVTKQPEPAAEEKEPDRMFLETHHQELILIEVCLKLGLQTVAMSGHPGDLDAEDNEINVQRSAQRYYDFIVGFIKGRRT